MSNKKMSAWAPLKTVKHQLTSNGYHLKLAGSHYTPCLYVTFNNPGQCRDRVLNEHQDTALRVVGSHPRNDEGEKRPGAPMPTV